MGIIGELLFFGLLARSIVYNVRFIRRAIVQKDTEAAKAQTYWFLMTLALYAAFYYFVLYGK